jgi:predicted enzyme related to lactoylglutathione lyase
MLNLSTIMINSENPTGLKDFYTKVLGEPQWSGGDFTGWRAGSGMVLVGPHSDVKGTNEMPGRIMATFETTDVAGEFARITGLGGRAVQPPYHPEEADDEGMLATVADPDGNYLQLASPMPADM